VTSPFDREARGPKSFARRASDGLRRHHLPRGTLRALGRGALRRARGSRPRRDILFDLDATQVEDVVGVRAVESTVRPAATKQAELERRDLAGRLWRALDISRIEAVWLPRNVAQWPAALEPCFRGIATSSST